MSGGSNAQKTWFNSTQNRFARRKARDAIQLLGKALPASVVSVNGSIVTVNFEVDAAPFTLPRVTVPLFGPEYIRYPIQPGCKGVVFPADARIGSMSGLGSGTPKLTTPGNLSALVFFPIGNSGWTAPEDTQATIVSGPNGAILRTTDGASKVTVNSDGVKITAAASEATGDLKVDGALSAGNGATGSFTAMSGETVTVVKGIVTGIA